MVEEERPDLDRSVEGILAAHLARAEGAWSIDLEALVGEHPEHADELRAVGPIMEAVLSAFRELGNPADPTLAPDEPSAEPSAVSETDIRLSVGGRMPSQLFLRRLAVHRPVHPRYKVERELARGGMGTILRVWDGDLLRSLAMKVAHGDAHSAGLLGGSSARALERFLNEAQITGQLEHPGIVPVHELGLDEEGRIFFTMPLVKGLDLHQVLGELRQGKGEWTRGRVLEILIKVCDAVGFAHERRILHRDLKPSNVMVGRSGEVYAVDWGLARIMDGAELRDIRVDRGGAATSEIFVGERFEGDAEPLRTMDGEVLGTPAYMSPEQARGEIESMGPPSDVYSVGAILYELLAGVPPYTRAGESVHPRRIWARVLEGPPTSLEELDPELPPELVAICERAMARRMEERYPDTAAMAADLRAHLEGRVVAAHRTGAWIELSKWVRRNRPVAASLAALLIVLVGAIGALAFVQSSRAGEQAAHAGRLKLLLDVSTAQVLFEEARRGWPVEAASLSAIDHWLARWREIGGAGEAVDPAQAALAPIDSVLARRLTMFEEYLADPPDPSDPLAAADDVREVIEKESAVLRELVARERRLRASEPHNFLAGAAEATEERLEEAHEHLARARRLLGDRDTGWVGEVMDLRRSIERSEATRLDPAWSEVLAELAAGGEPYAPLAVAPQVGLVPLRRDPESNLWEFLHVLSGEAPEVDVRDRWIVAPETGIVLVLVPGGQGWMGAQRMAPDGPNYDPQAGANEQPPFKVELEPFLISKYEVTSDQWLRLAGTRPSQLYVGQVYQIDPIATGAHPVEQVSWNDAMDVLGRHGLDLPTEAQWEWAARGRSELAQWFRTSPGRPESLLGWLNFLGAQDGWIGHSPVGSFEPNPFGLFDVVGNVWEWCRDDYVLDYREASLDSETTMIVGWSDPGATSRSFRGGSWRSDGDDLRVSLRYPKMANYREFDLGVRPIRALER